MDRRFISLLTQRIKIKNILFASTFDVVSGAPQGNIFNPLLFIIFIDDIVKVCNKFNVVIKFYADDKKVFEIIKSYTDVLALQNCSTEISKWINMWLIEISFDKCTYIRFGTPVLEFQYRFDNYLIKKCRDVIDLGVSVGHDHKFS